jgi:hypothetical protein
MPAATLRTNASAVAEGRPAAEGMAECGEPPLHRSVLQCSLMLRGEPEEYGRRGAPVAQRGGPRTEGACMFEVPSTPSSSSYSHPAAPAGGR